MIEAVRVSVDLPKDVYGEVCALADNLGVSLDDALTAVVRRGLAPSVNIDTTKAFPCFAISSDAEPITLDQTLQAEDEL